MKLCFPITLFRESMHPLVGLRGGLRKLSSLAAISSFPLLLNYLSCREESSTYSIPFTPETSTSTPYSIMPTSCTSLPPPVRAKTVHHLGKARGSGMLAVRVGSECSSPTYDQNLTRRLRFRYEYRYYANQQMILYLHNPSIYNFTNLQLHEPTNPRIGEISSIFDSPSHHIHRARIIATAQYFIQ